MHSSASEPVKRLPKFFERSPLQPIRNEDKEGIGSVIEADATKTRAPSRKAESE
jgi:hypothetical protein